MSEPSERARQVAREWLIRQDNRFHHETYMSNTVTELADLLTRYASAARLDGLIEARRVLGTGQANFERWLALRITAERAAQQKAPGEGT